MKNIFNSLHFQFNMVILLLVGGLGVSILIFTSINLYNLSYTFSNEIVRKSTNESLSKMNLTLMKDIEHALDMTNNEKVINWLKSPDDLTLQRTAYEEFNEYRWKMNESTVFIVPEKSRNFILNNSLISQITEENPDDSWYFMTRDADENMNLNIDHNDDLDTTKLWINIRVEDNGEFLGVAGAGIDITNFVNLISSSSSAGEEVITFNSDLMITAHEQLDFIGSKKVTDYYSDIKDVNAVRIVNKVVEHHKNEHHSDSHGENHKIKNDEFFFDFYSGSNGKKFAFSIYHIDSIDWFIVIKKDISHLKIMKFILPLIIFIALATLVLIIITILLINNLILKKIDKMKKATDLMVNNDLRDKEIIISKNEIGEFSRNIALLNTTFNKIIRDIKNLTGNSQNISHNLNANTTQVSATTEEISANINSIQQLVNNLDDQIKTTNEAVNKIIDNIMTVDSRVENQSEAVTTSSTAVEEMIASINSIAKNATDREEHLRGMVDLAREGEEAMRKTEEAISSISKSSDKILEVTKVISDLGDQTNLLAMNASIEAAHAGESGKGFAVVAGEIRKLSEKTGQNTRLINESMREILEKITATSETGKDTGNKIKNMADGVNQFEQTLQEMIAGLREISDGSKQINDAISILVDAGNSVKEAAGSVRNMTSSISESMESVHHLSHQTLNGLKEIATGSSEITTSMVNISNLSNDNLDGIKAIDEEISRFKLD